MIATLALGLGLGTGAVSLGSFGISDSLAAPASVQETANQVLNGTGNTNDVVNKIDGLMGVATDAGVAASGDPQLAASVAKNREFVRNALTSLFNDPELRRAVRDGVASVQGKLTTDPAGATPSVNGLSLSRALNTAPAVPARTPPAPAGTAQVGTPVTLVAAPATARRSEADWFRTLADHAGLVALALLAIALVFSRNRLALVRKLARTAMLVGVFPLIGFVFMPAILGNLGTFGDTIATSLHANAAGTVTPGLVIALVGLGIGIASTSALRRTSMVQLARVAR
ncbi:MAG: hypothetical protein ACOYN3_06500 [Acidimicrobiia bacterium]